MAGIKIMLAMPINRDIPSPTVHSLLQTQGELMHRGMDVCFMTFDGCSLVHRARSNLAYDFLNSDCTHLFWVDSDLQWKAKDFLKLAALGTKMDVVCGAYPAKEEPAKFYFAPVEKTVEYNEYGCVEIKHLAMGFSIAQRKVIESLAKHAPKASIEYGGEKIPRTFRCDIHDGQERGEDVAYFSDIRELGFKIWVCPSICISHIGQKIYDYKLMDLITSQECNS